MRRYFLLAASSTLLLAILIIAWQEGRRPPPVPLTPTITGQVEYCLTCHLDLEQISNVHPVQSFGCVLCHGGEPRRWRQTWLTALCGGGKNPFRFLGRPGFLRWRKLPQRHP